LASVQNPTYDADSAPMHACRQSTKAKKHRKHPVSWKFPDTSVTKARRLRGTDGVRLKLNRQQCSRIRTFRPKFGHRGFGARRIDVECSHFYYTRRFFFRNALPSSSDTSAGDLFLLNERQGRNSSCYRSSIYARLVTSR